jgi:Protein of unknown function (DUF1569)
MKNLFEPTSVQEVKQRIAQLRPDSERRWGKMNPGQALAHCSRAMETALGDTNLPRMLIGRIIGGPVKRMALGNDEPMKRNSPTSPAFVVRDQPDVRIESARLTALIERFADGGPKGCTTHPHTFFGPMTPDEWAILMYKHVDHHLRQFGA